MIFIITLIFLMAVWLSTIIRLLNLKTYTKIAHEIATYIGTTTYEEILFRPYQFHIKNNSITRTTADPIQLELNQESRNWEGLVRLDRTGFLVIVDEYPRTILAFVKK